MVVVGNDIFDVLLPDVFFFGHGQSIEVFDEKFADPDNLPFLDLLWFWYLSESIEEELFQEGDNLFWRIFAISFLEQKTEQQSFGYFFLCENDLELLHIFNDKFYQIIAWQFVFVAVPDSFQNHWDMEIDVILFDVFLFDVVDDGLTVIAGLFWLEIVEISHCE